MYFFCGKLIITHEIRTKTLYIRERGTRVDLALHVDRRKSGKKPVYSRELHAIEKYKQIDRCFSAE